MREFNAIVKSKVKKKKTNDNLLSFANSLNRQQTNRHRRNRLNRKYPFVILLCVVLCVRLLIVRLMKIVRILFARYVYTYTRTYSYVYRHRYPPVTFKFKNDCTKRRKVSDQVISPHGLSIAERIATPFLLSSRIERTVFM